jgi:DNA gyrase subunit B
MDKERVDMLMETIVDFESFVTSIERKGISFRDFLAARTEKGLYPRYQVAIGEKTQYIYTEEELLALKKDNEDFQRKTHEETLASIPPEEITEEMRSFVPKSLLFVDLYDPNRLTMFHDKLASFGLTFDQYLIADGALFDLLEEGNMTVPFHTLRELIEAVRTNGRKGVEVQRYKGLGEMNADQLWETTMNPATRTLVKVTLPDAIAADHMFSMLMGEEVEPRRLFIEQHALYVKNLDI